MTNELSGSPKRGATKSTRIKTSFRIEEETLLRLKALAFVDRKTVQDLMHAVFNEYFQARGEDSVDKSVELYKRSHFQEF